MDIIEDTESTALQLENAALRQRVMHLEHILKTGGSVERILWEREEQFRTIADFTYDWEYWIDPDGTYRYVSPSCERITGYSPHEFMNDPRLLELIVHPDDQACFACHIEQVATPHQEPMELVFRLRTREGDERYIEHICQPVNGTDGHWLGRRASNRDITDRVHAEQARREREEIYRAMFEKNQAVKLLIDPQTGAIVDANPAASAFYGYPREALRRMHITNINTLPPDEIHAEMQRAHDEERTYFLFRHRLASGEVRDVEVHSSPIEVQGRTLLFSIIHDITERKEAEEALLTNQRFLTGIIETMPDTLYVYDMIEHRNIYVNREITRMLGYTPQEVQAMGSAFIATVLHPDDTSIVAEHLERLTTSQDGGVLPAEYRLRHADGSWRWLHVQSTVFARTPTGAPRYTLGVVQDTTERKQAEEAYRVVVDHSVQGLIIFQDGRVVFANTAAARIVGYSQAALLAMSSDEVAALIYPDDYELVAQCWQDRVAGNDVQHTYIFRILRSDGAVRWLEGSSILVEYKGRPAVQMAYVDITERKEAEEALRESEARYRTLVESTEDAVFQLDPEGHYMFVNNAVERILGRSRDDLVGSHLSDIFPPQHAPVPTQMLENVLATSQPVRVEHPLMIGEECTEYSTELMPVYDPDGDIAFVMGVGRDITERKRAEARMRANQARLQAIFDSAAVGIGLINKEWRYIEVNDTLAEMVGYTAEELYQMTPLDLTHPDDVPMSHIYLQALMRGDKQHYRVEKRFHRKNGSVMWIDLSVAPICDETGKPELILGIFTDVSERKHAETELREANERLTHWVRELEQHNHNVAQLNEMSGFLQGCQTLEEAYPVVAHFAHQLFPNHSGALYLFSPEDRLEAMATWGKAPPDVRELAAQRCKVLRSKRAYISSNVEHPVPCNCELAAAPSSPEHIMCLPLVAHAETLGVLHLRNANASDSIWQERWKRLAMMLSGQLALELANLRLRIRLRDQSIRDALTGMFNRRYLDEMLKTELRRADRYEHPVGVIMLDIDHFKQFNDTYGHDGGDVLLRKVGAFLQSNTRGEDIACRYGGEEFMLVLPGASLEDTQQRAEDIRTEIIALQVHHHGQPLRAITASLGVAAYPMHSTSDEDLIKAADQALYRAKARGRNRVEVAELPAGAGDA